jgi:hypothetical protein
MKPNFFIIGAPKCGTTALSEYLKAHPQIFFCEPKEPHFFAEDIGLRYIKTHHDYDALFRKAGPQHLAVGEGSVCYLYSKLAAAKIKDFCPNARIIVMVRNPIEMAYSLHGQLFYARIEDEPDFSTAWGLQKTRQAGGRLPRGCRAPSLLQYRQVCELGVQLERLLEIFPREQVLVQVFDDFVRDPGKVYRTALDFLDIPDDGRATFPVINESKLARFNSLAWANNRLKPVIVSAALWLSHRFGIEIMSYLRKIESFNTKKFRREPLSPQLRALMSDEFADDVQKLSNILQRDLGHWLTH